MATLTHFILQTGPLNNRLNLLLATKSVSLCCMVSYLVFGLICLREYAAAEEQPCVSTPGGHFLLLPSPQPADVLLDKTIALDLNGGCPARKPSMTKHTARTAHTH